MSITDISPRNNTRAEGSEDDAVNKVGDQTMHCHSINDRGADDLRRDYSSPSCFHTVFVDERNYCNLPFVVLL